MVQLRIYDKAGGVQASMTSPVANGAVDYLGHGLFVSTNIDTVEMFALTSPTSAVLVKTLVTFGANQDGVGVLCRSSHHRWWDELDADGPNVLIAMKETIGITQDYTLRDHNLSDGGLNQTAILFAGTVSAWGGMCGNGSEIYLALTDTSPSTDVYHVELSGNTVGWNRRWSFATLPLDMSYDGHYLWTLEGTTCKQYEQDGATLPRLCNSFTTAGTTPAGICTDGEFLYIISRT